MPYNAFTSRVLPSMQDYDQELVELLMRWKDTLHPGEEGMDEKGGKPAKSKKKKKAQKVPPDLLTAANPKNPYPIYLTLKKTEKFRMEELTDIYVLLGHTDMKLKRSVQDPKIVLEEVILKICRT
jgi:DNA polymerase-3 subunit delta